MVELWTDAGQKSLTAEQPYLIHWIAARYILIAEQIADTQVVLCVFDSQNGRVLLPETGFAAPDAQRQWQFWVAYLNAVS